MGCRNCEFAWNAIPGYSHCPDAFTERAQHCALWVSIEKGKQSLENTMNSIADQSYKDLRGKL